MSREASPEGVITALHGMHKGESTHLGHWRVWDKHAELLVTPAVQCATCMCYLPEWTCQLRGAIHP